MSPRHVDMLMTTRERAATTGVEVDFQLAREPPVNSRRISSPRMRKKIASRPSEHHSGAAREMLAVRATRTKRRRAHMRSAIESLIHSPDEYILVKPALYSTSHQGRQLVFARSDSQRRENLMTLPEKLAAFRTSFEAGGPPYNAPDCVNELMHRATDELIASGAAERALKAGDRGRNSPSRTLMVTRCRHETCLRGGRSW